MHVGDRLGTTNIIKNMERLGEAIRELIEDESIADYLREVAEASETVDDFKDVALPILMDLEGIVESEEDAGDLLTSLFHMRDPPVEKPVEEMNKPIIMSAILQDGVEDPFDQERLAMARLAIQEVGTVDEVKNRYTWRKLQ